MRIAPAIFRAAPPALALLLGAPALAGEALPRAAQLDEDESRAKALEVMDRFIEKIGGEELIRSRTNLTQTGTFALPAAGLSGDMVVYAKAPNLLALQIDLAGVGQIRTGYNGQVGWSNNPFEGATLMEDQQLRDIQLQADLFNALTPEKYYETITYEGESTFNGEKVHVVKLADDEASDVTRYYSVESGLLIGSTSLQAGNFGEVEVKSTVSDYKDFDGMLFATKNTQSIGPQVIEITFDNVTFDEVDDDVFALPPAIQALVDSQQPVTAP
ncbi:MAG: hypothetical protein ACIARR_05735 [Phycisphaerales bacterium JB059]